MGRVHGGRAPGRARPRRRAASSPCSRRTPAQAAFSAGCSETCTCSGRPAATKLTAPSSARGTARTEWIATPTVMPSGRGEVLDPLGPAADVAVAEAKLRPGQRLVPGGVEPAGQVAGVQQRQPDAGVRGGLAQRLRHRVLVGVPDAARRVVQVVELADRGDAGQGHLGVRRTGEREVGVRVEPGGDRVHRVAPGPEGPAAAMGPATQRPVEGVAVGVGEARAARCRAAGSGVARTLSAVTAGEPAVGHVEPHVSGQAGGQPRVVREPPHRARSSMTATRASTPARQSTVRRARRASARRRSGCGRTASRSGCRRRRAMPAS